MSIALNLIGHLSFVLTAASFALRDMMLLRLLAIASGALGLIYNYTLPGGPLWLVLFWLSVFMLINIVQIVRLLWARHCVRLSEEEQTLREQVFSSLTPAEMTKLMRHGEWREAGVGHTFVLEGSEPDTLQLLLSGEARVLRGGVELARCDFGSLIGEMSFIQHTAACATVLAASPCRYLVWSRADLESLCAACPSFAQNLQQVLAINLARKLAHSA